MVVTVGQKFSNKKQIKQQATCRCFCGTSHIIHHTNTQQIHVSFTEILTSFFNHSKVGEYRISMHSLGMSR